MVDTASREGAREEDCRTANEEERRVPENHADYIVHGRRKGRKIVGAFGGQRKSDERCAQHGGSEEVDGSMARHRQIWLEFVDIIVKSDNEPALTSLIESWSTLRAMKSGPRMIIENCLVGSSKSTGIVQRAIQSVRRMIRTTRSAIEEKWEVNLNVTHFVWLWIADQAGFLLTRFEVGCDGRMGCDPGNARPDPSPRLRYPCSASLLHAFLLFFELRHALAPPRPLGHLSAVRCCSGVNRQLPRRRSHVTQAQHDP